jgi:hypothetical protein
VRVLNMPALRVHFVVAVDEEAAARLEALRERVPGLGDTTIRLPKPPQRRTPVIEERATGASAVRALVGSIPPQEPPLTGSAPMSQTRVGASLLGTVDAREGRQEPILRSNALADVPQAPGSVIASQVREESGRPFAPPPPEDRAASETAIPAQARAVMPRAAWALLGLLLASAFGLLLLTVWQPRQRAVDTNDAPFAGAPASGDTTSARAVAAAEPSPIASPADDQTPLPLIRKEVPRSEPAVAPAKKAPAVQRALPQQRQASTAVPTQARGATSSSGPVSSVGGGQSSASSRPMAMVYVHVRSESQRAWAEQLVQPLAKRGIRVTGIRVVSAGPGETDLRYFRGQEAPEALRVARALRELGVPTPRLKRVSGLESRSTPRQYELWLPPGKLKSRR